MANQSVSAETASMKMDHVQGHECGYRLTADPFEPNRLIDERCIAVYVVPVDGSTSDGYYTFNELYDHRRALTAALAALAPSYSWRSRKHHPEDSPCYPGYFIVGINLPTHEGGGPAPITYHYEDQYWDDFRAVRELEHAPKWDGAEPALTVTRLLDLARNAD